jgi:hypothetical protein
VKIRAVSHNLALDGILSKEEGFACGKKVASSTNDSTSTLKISVVWSLENGCGQATTRAKSGPGSMGAGRLVMIHLSRFPLTWSPAQHPCASRILLGTLPLRSPPAVCESWQEALVPDCEGTSRSYPGRTLQPHLASASLYAGQFSAAVFCCVASCRVGSVREGEQFLSCR